jgi:5'-nucleotidase/UDP-sugar diphosphatase
MSDAAHPQHKPLFDATATTPNRTFTILHTNDIHSNLIGMSPATDYSPFTLNDDQTIGGFARLATVIRERKEARQDQGPVLILDGGDYSMGTAFGAAIRDTGGELQLMAMMGYDATTFGNHDFDLGPDGLGQGIDVATKAGRIPAVVAANTNLEAQNERSADLQRLARDGVIRQYLVIERGGIRFGIFGLIGKEAVFYVLDAGAVTFDDPIETARAMVTRLREHEHVDVVICLSHGGVMAGPDGHFTDGEDIELAQAVPGIDVLVGSHSHTELWEPVIVNGRTPVIQAGKYSEHLGELVIALDGDAPRVVSYPLHPIDDAVIGDRAVAAEVDRLKGIASEVVFDSRGYRIDQPLAVAPQDLPNTFADIAASTPLGNLVSDAIRQATHADVGLTVNGLMRAGLTRGKSGVQTVYDVFALAPLGFGIVDRTAGSALVCGYFTGKELKSLLEFFLVDNPAHPGEYFPRVSGLRFSYDPSRPTFDVVTEIELGDLDHRYRPIDISGADEQLYSVGCPLYAGLIIASIPKTTNGQLALVPKNKDGHPLKDRTEALVIPAITASPFPPPPKGEVDKRSVVMAETATGVGEIKEWQAIMDFLRGLPTPGPNQLPTIPVDGRAREVRAIRAER